MKIRSPLVVIFAAFMARMVASMLATEALLSKMPGPCSVSPARRTLRLVSSACTMSMCAAKTMVGPPPVPLRTPITLPMESVETRSPSAIITLRT
jgi:hypothetical protein